MPLPISTSTAPRPNGLDFLDEYAGHIETLYETGSRPLTTVGGTANVVTATMPIDLTAAGLVDGICVTITWVAANTAGVTLAINGGSAIPVVDAKGAALFTGTITAGLTSLLRYTAGQWRIMSGFGADTDTGGPTDQTFTTSGTWTKPNNYDPNTVVFVELWGGGGAGGTGSGAAGGGAGGGGAYACAFFRIGDLPGSVAVTVAAGGAAPNGNGGNSQFGSLLTAYGGGGGSNYVGADVRSGSGGGELEAATQAQPTVSSQPGVIGGGTGGNATAAGAGNGLPLTIFGGGGGCRHNSSTVNITTRNNGRAYYGGGGGGGSQSGFTSLGGSSVFGGRGGDGGGASAPGENGVAPGGGGASAQSSQPAGNGARGQARIRIFG